MPPTRSRSWWRTATSGIRTIMADYSDSIGVTITAENVEEDPKLDRGDFCFAR